MSTDFDNELENSEWLNSEPIISSNSGKKPSKPVDDLFSSIIAEAEASYISSKEKPPEEENTSEEKEETAEHDVDFTVTKRRNFRAGDIADKIKKSEMFQPETIKDMFFGSREQPQPEGDEDDISDEEDEEQPALFDKRPRYTADVKKDKLIFEAEYSLTTEQAIKGYLLYHNEFVQRRNMKMSLLFATLSVMFLISILFSPRTPLLYILFIVCVMAIVLKWLTSAGSRREALKAAERVKNDSYKLSFYSSRIIIKCSELSGDTLYTYPPVMIRFEDIDLKVIDYDDLYVLIFKGDMIYTIPKSSFTDRMNNVFVAHLMNILGDDYIEFFTRKKRELPKIGRKKDEDAENDSEDPKGQDDKQEE